MHLDYIVIALAEVARRVDVFQKEQNGQPVPGRRQQVSVGSRQALRLPRLEHSQHWVQRVSFHPLVLQLLNFAKWLEHREQRAWFRRLGHKQLPGNERQVLSCQSSCRLAEWSV